MSEHAVCRVADLDAHGSYGFVLDAATRRHGFVVAVDTGIRAYVNHCPHAGGTLEWREHDFLTSDRQHIVCGRHGALFAKEDGRCVDGPCGGGGLEPLAARVVDGAVLVESR